MPIISPLAEITDGYDGRRKRIMARPTRGDWTLIPEMDPNRPYITQTASELALNSGDSDDSDVDDDDKSYLIEMPHTMESMAWGKPMLPMCDRCKRLRIRCKGRET